jgi:hypothetical protein
LIPWVLLSLRGYGLELIRGYGLDHSLIFPGADDAFYFYVWGSRLGQGVEVTNSTVLSRLEALLSLEVI